MFVQPLVAATDRFLLISLFFNRPVWLEHGPEEARQVLFRYRLYRLRSPVRFRVDALHNTLFYKRRVSGFVAAAGNAHFIRVKNYYGSNLIF